ncbi:MAG: type II toxin-antitoxin system HicB family antitoxin [Thermoplasmatota archaeon]
MDFQVVLERDPETRSYTGSVPGLPIVIDAKTKRSALKMVKEAIAFYLEDAAELGIPRPKPVEAQLIKVKV